MPDFPALVKPLFEAVKLLDDSDTVFEYDVRSANWDGGGSLASGRDTTATKGYLFDYGTGAIQVQALYVAGEITGADVYSNNWDGTTPANLATKDGGASAGYYLDDSSGGAQFQLLYAEGGSLGTLDVDGTLTMGSGGMIRTASSGQRIEITNTTSNYIEFFSGDVDEVLASRLRNHTLGSGATRTVNTLLSAPFINTDDKGVYISVRSASADASTYAPVVVIGEDINYPGAGTGATPQFHILNSIPLITSGDITLTAGDITLTAGDITLTAGVVQLDDLGSAAAPAVGIGTSYDDGMYSRTDSELNFTTAGVERVRLSAKRFDIKTGSVDFLGLPVKGTTGDPSSGGQGDMYVNSFDRLLRVYSNAAWHTVASW